MDSMSFLKNFWDYELSSQAFAPWSSSKIQEVKSKCLPAVVIIRVAYIRKIGIEGLNNTATATGFVVDNKNGLILTNRHVVMTGPVRATAEFQHRTKKELVDIFPVYRDPIHDYGFFRFDLGALESVELVTEIKLNPSAAASDLVVLIAGNQKGAIAFQENIKILDVRANPESGMDFNTFMITADDKTLPGYSGGPILDINGDAVAMVSTTLRSTNMSYHFPLERCLAILEKLSNKKPVSRGTIQANFKFRLIGDILETTSSASILHEVLNERFNDDSMEGLLCADAILKNGPAHQAGLKWGDVLLEIDGKPIKSFIDFEEVVDENIESSTVFLVFSKGEIKELILEIQDFREIEASEYLEVSNAIVHGIEFVTALVYNIPLRGVFLVQSGYMFNNVVPDSIKGIIVSMGDISIRTLDDFQDSINAYSDGSLMKVQYFLPHDPMRTNFGVIQLDKHWYPFQRARRDNLTGEWIITDCTSASNSQNHRMSIISTASYDTDVDMNDITKRIENSAKTGNNLQSYFARLLNLRANTFFLASQRGKFAELHNSVVSIRFAAPFPVDSSTQDDEGQGRCVGVILDKMLGLVVCERYTVFTTLGNALITFNSLITVDAKVVFVHPFHFFSILRYDVEEIARHSILEIKDIPISKSPVSIGDRLIYAGMTIKFTRIVDFDCSVGSKESFYLSRLGSKVESFTPKNAEYFQGTERSMGMGGVYVDPSDFTVKGLNIHLTSFRIQGGIQASDIYPCFHMVRDALLRKKRPPSTIRVLGVHLRTKPLVEVSSTSNLSQEWINRLLESMDDFQRNVLVVSKRMSLTDAHDKLKNGDVILAINQKTTTNFADFNGLTLGKRTVSATVMREGSITTIPAVSTSKITCVGTYRILLFAGMLLQPVPPSALFSLDFAQRQLTKQSIYISFVEEGSPGRVANCRTSSIIYRLNKSRVESMDDLIHFVSKLMDKEKIALELISLENGTLTQASVALDLQFWRTRLLERNNSNFDWRSFELIPLEEKSDKI